MKKATTTRRAGFFSALALSGALIAASGAAAFEGRYVAGSRSYVQDIVVAKRADGRFSVKAEVATPGCTGEFEGAGALQGDALVAEAKFENETCALTPSPHEEGRERRGRPLPHLPWGVLRVQRRLPQALTRASTEKECDDGCDWFDAG